MTTFARFVSAVGILMGTVASFAALSALASTAAHASSATRLKVYLSYSQGGKTTMITPKAVRARLRELRPHHNGTECYIEMLGKTIDLPSCKLTPSWEIHGRIKGLWRKDRINLSMTWNNLSAMAVAIADEARAGLDLETTGKVDDYLRYASAAHTGKELVGHGEINVQQGAKLVLPVLSLKGQGASMMVTIEFGKVYED